MSSYFPVEIFSEIRIIAILYSGGREWGYALPPFSTGPTANELYALREKVAYNQMRLSHGIPYNVYYCCEFPGCMICKHDVSIIERRYEMLKERKKREHRWREFFREQKVYERKATRETYIRMLENYLCRTKEEKKRWRDKMLKRQMYMVKLNQMIHYDHFIHPNSWEVQL